MKTTDALMVRAYLMESSHLSNQITTCLHDEAGIQGISVFRAIQGDGETGRHGISLIDVSLDLPLVVEFFANKNKATHAIKLLEQFIKKEHLAFWPVQTNA